MSTEASTRPFQVGDRVRITGWGTSGPREIIIDSIDPADPCGRFGPYISGDGPDGHGTCAMNDDLTGVGEHDTHTIELLEPAAVPQDHGPLAAPLSDRTLAKVLSRPAHVPLSEMKSTRVFGFNVVTISPQGIPGGPRLDGVVSRQRAQDELDELEPFMVDGWKTVMVELREVVS